MNKKSKIAIAAIGTLLVLGIIFSIVLFSMKKKANNYSGEFSVQPIAYMGFDGKDSISYKQPQVEVQEGVKGKGIEMASARNNAVIIDEKGFAKNLNGAETITVSMWVMPYIHRVSSRLFTIYLDSVNAGIYADYSEEQITVYARSFAAETRKRASFSYNLYDGTMGVLGSEHTNSGVWQNLIFVIDFAESEIKLYVNGKDIEGSMSREDAGDFDKKKFMCVNPDNMVLGSSANYEHYPFNGIMDEVYVFNQKLSKDDYRTLWEKTPESRGSVDDQKYIQNAIEYMKDSVVFAKNKNFYIKDGKMEQISYADYSKISKWNEDECYIPAETAEVLFGVKASEDVSLKYIQEQTGKEVLYFDEYDVAVVCAKDISFDTDQSKGYIARLSKFFSDERIKFPEMDAEVSRVVVEEMVAGGTSYLGSPSVCELGQYLYVSYDCLGSTYVERSADGGITWERCGTILRMFYGTIFAHRNKLYVIGTVKYNNKDYVGITCSEDNGVTWSSMDDEQGILLSKSEAHTSSTPVVVHDGYIYKGFEFNPYNIKSRLASVISAKEDADLLNPESWIIANGVKFSSQRLSIVGTTDEVTVRNTSAALLEGNVVVGKDGEVYNILRVQSQPYYDYATVTKVSQDRKLTGIDKVIKFYGGKTKFTIRYDEKTQKYISFVNTVEDVHLSEQRNVVAMVTSTDMYNWEIESYVLADRALMNYDVSASMKGFQYIDWTFSGDNILLSVREATGNTDNFHNADDITIYTVKNYKSYISE